MKKQLLILALVSLTLSVSVFGALSRKAEVAKLPNPAGEYNATKKLLKLDEGAAKVIAVEASDNEKPYYAVKLILPEFVRGVAVNTDWKWPSMTNRAFPWTFSEGFAGLKVPRGVSLLLLELPNGKTMVLLPITTPKQLAYFDIQDKACVLAAATFGKEKVSGVSCIAACDADPYRALSLVFEKAFTLEEFGGRFQARRTKTYPEMFKYLGWCSWEQYRLNITSNSLVKAAKEIKASGLPVRFFLVDDGHQVNRKKNRKLSSFDPDPKTFPKGWVPLIAQRDPKTLKWMGLWHAFHGNWEGMDTKNDFSPAVKKSLIKTGKGKRKSLMPGETDKASATFYNAFLGAVKRQGFDFVKIDVQSASLGLYRGISKNPVAASIRNQKSLIAACTKYGLGLLNCMCGAPHNTFFTGTSAVSRCSVDYKLNNAPLAADHIWQSYFAATWQAQSVWLDHDMFHSNDSACGQLMAISKALSAGPIYLSDPPEEFVAKFIMPLCYRDGKLLRPLAPGTPMRDSLMVDPMKEAKAFRVIVPLANGAASICAYNLCLAHKDKPAATVKTQISASDYAQASALIQPYHGPWKLPAGGLVYFDWHTQKGGTLAKDYVIELAFLKDRLVHLLPVQQGWAVVGRADKYISPAAVETIKAAANELSFTLCEAGPVVIYSAKGTPKSEGLAWKAIGEGFYRAEMPIGDKVTITVTR